MSSDSPSRKYYAFILFIPFILIFLFWVISRTKDFFYHYILVFSFRFWTPNSRRRLHRSYSDHLWSPLLFLAIKSRNTALVQHVLNTPDLIQHRDDNYDTALHIAVRHFKPEILQLVIGYSVQAFDGAPMANCKDLTPFHVAGKKKNEEALRMLVRVPELKSYQCDIKKNDPRTGRVTEDRGMTFLNFYVEDECLDSSDEYNLHDDRNYIKPRGDKLAERKAFVKEIREYLDPQIFEVKTTSGRTLDYILSSSSHSQEDVKMENSSSHQEEEQVQESSSKPEEEGPGKEESFGHDSSQEESSKKEEPSEQEQSSQDENSHEIRIQM